MADDDKHVNKGRNEPRIGVLEQARVHVALARQLAEALGKHGWTPEQTAQLERDAAGLDGQIAAQAEARGLSHQAGADELAARTEAKAFLRTLRHALPMVLRDQPASGVTAASFESGRLGASTAKISAHLAKIRLAVVALDGPLARFLPGDGTPSARLDALKARLDAADSGQEVNVSGLPVETRAVYAAKGRVLEAIEDLNRIGKIAFDGQAEQLARFNKDVLVRARKTRKAAAAGDGAGVTTPA